MFAPYKTETDAPAKVAHDPFSLEALIAWLRTKPRSDEYCYTATGHCLIAQYVKSLGYAECAVGTPSFDPTIDVSAGGEWKRRAFALPDGWNEIAQNFPRSFGAALSRALALKASGAK